MEDLTIEELKQLVIFYKQKSNDLEFETLKLKLINVRVLNDNKIDKKPKP
jgi:hypothetical protein